MVGKAARRGWGVCGLAADAGVDAADTGVDALLVEVEELLSVLGIVEPVVYIIIAGTHGYMVGQGRVRPPSSG